MSLHFAHRCRLQTGLCPGKHLSVARGWHLKITTDHNSATLLPMDQMLWGSLVATLPASMIIPQAFKASATPPASVTVKADWRKVR